MSYLSGFFNRGSRTRTHDIRFWRPTFYRLNYSSMLKAKPIVQEKRGFVNTIFKINWKKGKCYKVKKRLINL